MPEPRRRSRIGIVGFGNIGSFLYREIKANPAWGLDIAFVYARSAVDAISADVRLTDLGAFEKHSPDLVVEAAHPSVTVEHGARFLAHCDYMPASVAALADPEVEQSLVRTAKEHGTRLLIPHGAATGLDTLHECRDVWESVTVKMTKNPENLDFASAQHLRPATTTNPTILYDGPTREVCSLFPRNVNTHAAVALAGIGFDRTRSLLIADPSINESIIELEATGGDVSLHIIRRNPLKGVSGILTLRSILGCVQRTTAPGIHLQLC